MFATCLLACLLATASLTAATQEETAFCKEQRKQCERGCPEGKIDFKCKDKAGARSVGCACAATGGNFASSSASSSSFSSSSGFSSSSSSGKRYESF